MSDFREEEKLGKLYDSRLTGRVMKYLRPYRWKVIMAVALSFAVAGADILGPFLFAVAIDNYVVPAAKALISYHAAIVGLLWIVAAYIGALATSFGLRYL